MKRSRRSSGTMRRASAVPARAARKPVMSAAALMKEAEVARKKAYAPYSRFQVGAALLGASGRVYHGCNVENASFSLTLCAERTAIFKAVSEGEREFVAIAVTAGPGKWSSPCGSCRQVLYEFAPGLRVHWNDERGRPISRPLEKLLAMAFDPSALEKS